MKLHRSLFVALCVVAAALAAALFAVPAARADGCHLAASYATYTPRTVHNYVAPHHDYHHETRLLILTYKPDFAVGYAQEERKAEKPAVTPCDEKIGALTAKLAALEAKLSVQPPAERPLTAAPPAPAAEPKPEPKPKPTLGSKEEVVKAGLAVLSKNCAACHTGSASKKNAEDKPVVIFTQPGAFNTDMDLFTIWESIESGDMPKKVKDKPAVVLTAEEKKAVRDLIRVALAK